MKLTRNIPKSVLVEKLSLRGNKISPFTKTICTSLTLINLKKQKKSQVNKPNITNNVKEYKILKHYSNFKSVKCPYDI